MAAVTYNLPRKLCLTGDLPCNWQRFKQELEIYLRASGLDEEKDSRKIAILLNTIGEDGVQIYNNFKFKSEVTFDTVIKNFNEYCEPKKNTIYSRFLFYNRKQQSGELFDQFFMDVKSLAKNCNFSDENDAIRDRIIFGSSDKSEQEKILLLGDIDLDQTIKRFRQAEISKSQSKCLQGNSQNAEAEVFKVHYMVQCRWCGGKHERILNKCPARGTKCAKCGKLNHFAKVCRTRNPTGQVKLVQNIPDSESQDNNEQLYCDSVCLNVNNVDCWEQNLILENVTKCTFKLDTGSDVNLIPISLFDDILRKTTKEKQNSIRLSKSKVTLQAYNGSKIKTFGTVLLEAKLNSKIFLLDFIVTNSGYQPTLGKEACLLLGIIERKIVNSIENDMGRQTIINKYEDVFSGSGQFPKKCRILLKKDSVPVSKPPHRVPLKLKEKLKNELERLCSLGVISKAEECTEWINRVVIVEKDDGSIRLCLDPRDLNKCILKKYYEIPTINDLKSQIGNSKFFSVLDLKESFWQIALTEDSKKYCTFSTIYGSYYFNVLPFGLEISAETFQEICKTCFSDIEGLFIYIDDFLIHAESKEEHDKILEKVLCRARELNIKFNPKKFQYLPHVVNYFGHEIVNGNLVPDREKVKAVLEYDLPTDKQSLQRFLGFVNYFREYIPNISEVTGPLRQLLKKNVEFVWNDNCTKCINDLKRLLINPPVLVNFNPKKQIVIQTDSSKDAIGCVLMQDGHPISFASKSLSKCESEYGQIDKEFLAILFACKKFHYYIYGRHVVVQTDHQPLVAIMNKEINNINSQRLRKIKLKLTIYDLDVQYVPGSKMHVADALSRASSNASSIDVDTSLTKTIHTINVSDAVQSLIAAETQKDPVLQQLKLYFEFGWPKCRNKSEDIVKCYYKHKDNIIYENGIVYLNYKIIVPSVLRERVIKKVHSSHFGINKTIARARSLFYWPNIENDFIKAISNCEICEKYSLKKCKEPMLLDEVPTLPFNKVGCDFCQWGNKTYFVVADYYSKWFELIHVSSLTASTVIKILKQIFSTHGIPKILRADNMPFNSFEFQNFAKIWKFEIVTSSPRYPRSNGFIERYVGIAKSLLKKSSESGIDLQEVLLEYRNTPVLGSPYSPSQLLFSRMTRTKLPVHEALLKPKLVTNFSEVQDKVNYQNKRNYDKTAKSSKHKFYSGQDIVYVKDNLWLPGKVVDIHKAPRSLILEDKNGHVFRRNTLHVKPSFYKNSPRDCNFDPSLENNEYLQMPTEESLVQRRDDCIQERGREEMPHYNRVQLRPRSNIVPPRYLNDYICD